MENVLIPLGVLLVMGVIVVALIRIAPRHQKELNNAFEEFAMQHGLRHQAEDDGQAREFAADFDGLGDLASSSPGGSRPADVVSGILDGQRIVVFRYYPRPTGDSAAEWFIAGLGVKSSLVDRCAVQFCRGEPDRETTCVADPVVKEHEVGSFNIVIRARDAASAGRLVEEEVLEKLAVRAGQLAFRPEVQVRGNRVIAYPADRGTTIDRASDLDGLLGLAKWTVNVAGGRFRT